MLRYPKIHRSILVFIFIQICMSVNGNDKALRTKFESGTWKYQTAVTLYQKDDLKVTFISAVHIGMSKYFKELNNVFKKYDVVLYEKISGYQEAIDRHGIKSPWNILSSKLRLNSQLNSIDYKVDNLIHADLTLKELLKQDGVEKEDVLDMDKLKKVNKSFMAADPKVLERFYRNLFTMNSIKNKIIIESRNSHCVTILNEQLKSHKNIAIFYGAAHFKDFQKRLNKLGFKEISKTWLTAFKESSK